MARFIGWTFPLYRPNRDMVKEGARELLLYLESLLTRTGIDASEVEKRIDGLRKESIGGLRYNISLLEKELGVEKEVKVERVTRAKRKKPKKEKKTKIERGGFFI